jgi:fatty acid desaturase
MKGLFKHSRWDAVLFLMTFFQLPLNFWLASTWDARSLSQNLYFYPLCLFLFWYNALIATHNFVHTPWFSSTWLNRAYAMCNSGNLLTPIIHYRYLHFNHHKYGNDRRDQFGYTQDGSSTFAHGRNGWSEPVLNYCGLAILRDDMSETFQQVRKHRESLQLYLELGCCLLTVVLYLLISWRFFVMLLLPVFYFGWFFTYLANYYEHYGAVPENKYADSTSHYGRIYNRLFCNEGYHQEHHLRPQVHWSQRPKVYQQLQHELDTADRRIIRFPPPLGFMNRLREVEPPMAESVPASLVR